MDSTLNSEEIKSDSTANVVEPKTLQNEKKTYTDPETGKFIPGNPGGGRPKLTEEERLAKKAREKFIDEYIQNLTEALPQITPVLIQKASEGDMNAIKEVNDRVMGKARQNIGLDGGAEDKPISILSNVIPSNNSNTKDTRNEEKNPCDSGGDIGEQDNIDSLIPDRRSTE